MTRLRSPFHLFTVLNVVISLVALYCNLSYHGMVRLMPFLSMKMQQQPTPMMSFFYGKCLLFNFYKEISWKFIVKVYTPTHNCIWKIFIHIKFILYNFYTSNYFFSLVFNQILAAIRFSLNTIFEFVVGVCCLSLSLPLDYIDSTTVYSILALLLSDVRFSFVFVSDISISTIKSMNIMAFAIFSDLLFLIIASRWCLFSL